MQKLLFFLLLFSFFACTKPPAKIQNLNFQKVNEISFDAIKLDATTNNKIIFVDVFTSWCGPCKYMDETAFRDRQLINLFEKDFINYKVDAEDFDGINIATTYRVGVYPTYLFLNSEGGLLLRLQGVFTPEALIEKAEYVKSL